jgi:hypothetical protein
MSSTIKFLIGLAAVLLIGWIYHGPLGQGEKFVNALEIEARAAVASGELPGIKVELGRHPLSRKAMLSGPANDYQREGMGDYPGLNDRVAAIDGISALQWTDEADARNGVPLLVECLIAAVLAYSLGLGLAWLLFGRPKQESYL